MPLAPYLAATLWWMVICLLGAILPASACSVKVTPMPELEIPIKSLSIRAKIDPSSSYPLPKVIVASLTDGNYHFQWVYREKTIFTDDPDPGWLSMLLILSQLYLFGFPSGTNACTISASAELVSSEGAVLRRYEAKTSSSANYGLYYRTEAHELEGKAGEAVRASIDQLVIRDAHALEQLVKRAVQ